MWVKLIGIALIILLPFFIRKNMLRIIWRLLFFWAAQKDEYVAVKNEWIIK